MILAPVALVKSPSGTRATGGRGGSTYHPAIALFEFRDVAVVRGGTTVLHHVDLSIHEGVLTALVGPSGAGKSTLLRMCNRLEVPSAGVIRFRGEDMAHLDVHRLRRTVGMVFQRPTLFPGTVAENLRVADPGLDDAGIAELLERVSLEPGMAERTGDTLSGGEAQRACVARTLATGPQVVLMDEPTSALDQEHRLEIESLARTLLGDGTTIVWVSHDADQVRRLADHVIEVDGGTARPHRGGDAPGLSP